MRLRLNGRIVSNDNAAVYRRWGYNDVCCPKDVRDAIENCPDGEELIFELNSGGGSVYLGFEMYSMIFAHKGPTTAEVLGIAGSAMSVFMTACDKALMSPVANVMLHRASTYASGSSQVMKETKQMLDTIDESILNAYTRKSNGKSSRDAFARMMRSETFLTAQQAVDCGLADGIMQPKGKAVGSDPEMAAASATPWAGLLELPPVEDLLRREQERATTEETNAAEQEEQKRSEPNMGEITTKEQLAEKFPELTAQIAKEAADAAALESARAERERITGIDALAMPGFEDIIKKAKEDPAQNAGTVAMAIVFAQKQAGSAALEQIQADVRDSRVNEVPAASSETGTGEDSEETVEQAAKAAVELWKNEGAVN